MDALYLPGIYIAELSEFPPEDIAFQAIVYGINIPLYAFVARTIIIFTARLLGLYHPSQYRYWPRLPWRILFKACLEIKRWYERVFQMGHHATGGFAGLLEAFSLLYKP